MSAAEPLQIPIDLIGDVASAECFHRPQADRRRRRIAAGARGEHSLVAHFKIDPELPPEGMDRAIYLEEKNGPQHEARKRARASRKRAASSASPSLSTGSSASPIRSTRFASSASRGTLRQSRRRS